MTDNGPAVTVRRSLLIWALAAMTLVVFSYLVTLFIAVAFVYLPAALFSAFPNIHTFCLLAGGIVVSIVIMWSLIPRRDRFSAPGPRLNAADHPRLFSEIATIATTLKEPMPAEVYLILDVNAWVAERGGVMGFGSRRVMGLGLPLLQIMTISQFRAILAHEFGHFYGGDTRLWPWIYKTRQAMSRALENLGIGADAISENRAGLIQLVHLVIQLAVLGLSGYWTLFMRASNWISRRHEYRADELACQLSGAKALIDGLRTLHGGPLLLLGFWDTEMLPALDAGCRPSICDGIGRFTRVPEIAKALSDLVDSALNAPMVDPHDTHPPLKDRIEAAQRVPSTAPSVENSSAISLLGDVDAMEVELLRIIEPRRTIANLRPVSWGHMGAEVYVPLWREEIREHVGLLAPYTIEQLPEALAQLKVIARTLRDPPGLLRTPEQRLGNATQLLWRAMAVSLFDTGWLIHTEPGEFYLERGTNRIAPAQMVQALMSGTMTAAEWVEHCRTSDISGMMLTPALVQQTSTS